MARQNNDEADDLLKVVKALSHPFRGQILEELTSAGDEGVSPSEFAKKLDVKLGSISYHFRELADLEMIELSRTVPRRGALQHYYTLTERGAVCFKALKEIRKALKKG